MTQKFVVKPSIFVVTINGADYKFAGITMREMEKFVAAEQAALAKRDADDPKSTIIVANALAAARRELLVPALRRGGYKIETEELMDMPAPLFNALIDALMKAHFLTLETKVTEQSVGETVPL